LIACTTTPATEFSATIENSCAKITLSAQLIVQFLDLASA
jgi:hypothetical protein